MTRQDANNSYSNALLSLDEENYHRCDRENMKNKKFGMVDLKCIKTLKELLNAKALELRNVGHFHN